jgi:hypothetical protein
MKIKKYSKPPYPEEIKLSSDPFVVFVTRTTAIHIEHGDSLFRIAKALEKYMKVPHVRAKRLAGYYMSLGERISGRHADEPWNRSGALWGAARSYRPVSRKSSGTRSK